MKIKNFFYLFACLFVCSCEVFGQPSGGYVVPLKSTPNKEILMPSNIKFSFDDSFIIGDASAVLLDRKSIVESSDLVLVTNGEHVIIMDSQGRQKGVISRVGRGPGEYSLAQDIMVDYDHRRIHIFDFSRPYIIHDYSFEGKWIEDRELPVKAFALGYDHNTFYAVLREDKGSYYCMIDYGSLKVRGYSNMKYEREEKTRIVTVPSVSKYDGRLFLFKPFSTTQYLVSNESATPYLTCDLGRLGLPKSGRRSWGMIESEGRSHMGYDSKVLAEDYLFVRVLYNSSIYYQIWNLKEMKLVFQHIMKSRSDKAGFPLMIKGKEYYVWPDDYSDGYLYCIIEDDALSKELEPEYTIDRNPVILKLKFQC